MSASDDPSFNVQTDGGVLRVVISAAVLRTFAGRTHVTVSELLEIYRPQLEEAAIDKARRKPNARQIRLEASDL